MKEHSLFLLAGFPAKETAFIQRAEVFRKEFEDGLRKTEIVTEFTGKAERQTENLTGIPIDVKITEAEERLRAGNRVMVNPAMVSPCKNAEQADVKQPERINCV